MSRSGARRVAAVVGLVGLLVTAGCGGDDDEASGPSGAGSASASASETSTAPTDTSESPESSESSEPATPGVEPASGDAITLTAYTANAPAGWTSVNVASGGARYKIDDGTDDANVFFFEIPSVDADLDRLAASVLDEYADDDVKPTRGPDREVDGVTGITLVGQTDQFVHFYKWSAIHDGMLVTVELQYYLGGADIDAVADSVLASLKFT